MSILAGLKSAQPVKEEVDNIGGGGFILDSGVHDIHIDLAFIGKSKGGAMSLTIHGKSATGVTLRNTLWITSGDAKGNKTTYTDKNTKQEVFLPGFAIANHICMLTAGKEIFDLDTETKTIKLYDFAQSKDVPTDVQVIPDIMNQGVKMGIIKQIVDKNVKDGAGNYVPSGETREENEIDKVFQLDSGKTVVELRAKGDAEFIGTWEDKWEGEVRNRTKGGKGATPNTGVSGAPSGAAVTTSSDMFSS